MAVKQVHRYREKTPYIRKRVIKDGITILNDVLETMARKGVFRELPTGIEEGTTAEMNLRCRIVSIACDYSVSLLRASLESSRNDYVLEDTIEDDFSAELVEKKAKGKVK